MSRLLIGVVIVLVAGGLIAYGVGYTQGWGRQVERPAVEAEPVADSGEEGGSCCAGGAKDKDTPLKAMAENVLTTGLDADAPACPYKQGMQCESGQMAADACGSCEDPAACTMCEKDDACGGCEAKVAATCCGSCDEKKEAACCGDEGGEMAAPHGDVVRADR